MLVVLELVKAGAGRREQHNTAGRGRCRRREHGAFQRHRMDDGCPRDLRLYLFRRSSNGVHPLHTGSQQWIQERIVTVLVLAAEDEMDVGGKRFQRLDSGIHVGGFGIVVKAYAGKYRDLFETMLHRLESADAVANVFQLAPCKHGATDSREHVLEVVRAFEGNVGGTQDEGLLSAAAENDLL